MERQEPTLADQIAQALLDDAPRGEIATRAPQIGPPTDEPRGRDPLSRFRAQQGRKRKKPSSSSKGSQCLQVLTAQDFLSDDGT